MTIFKKELQSELHYLFVTNTIDLDERHKILDWTIDFFKEWLNKKHDKFAEQYVLSDGNVYLKHAYRTIEDILEDIEEE